MTLPDPSLPIEDSPGMDSPSAHSEEFTPSLAEPSSFADAPLDVSVESSDVPDAPAVSAFEPSPPVPLTLAGSLKSAFAPTLVFMLAGVLLGLRVAAQATLPHIFQPGDYTNYQNVLDGLPVPHLLAWNIEALDFLAALRDLSGVTLPLIILFVFGPLWLVIVRRVNPTFHLVSHSFPPPNAPGNPDTAADSGQASAPVRVTASAALSTPLEFYGLIKSLTLLVAMGLPLAAVWILVDWEDSGTAPGQINLAPNSDWLIGTVWALRLLLLSMAFWAGFHRDGLAGDFTQPEWNSSHRKLPLLALRGACFGLLAFAACRFCLPQHLDEILTRFQTLGGFNRQTWSEVTWHVLLSFGLVWSALGCLFAVLNPPPGIRTHRALLLLPLAACLLAAVSQRRFAHQALATRYDMRPSVLQAISENQVYRPDVSASGVPDGDAASRELAAQLHLPFHPPAHPSGRTVVLFAPTQSVLVYQNNITLDGFTPDADFVTQATRFLHVRDYQSALSWVASKNLFNVPLLRFDTTGAIRTSLDDLTHFPHNAQFTPTLEQMFSVCASTPENEALLDQWADESKFAFPDRESRRLMGDLYRRFGDIKKSLIWYRKADMPASFLQRVGSEQPMYSAGTIHGILRWNGKPLIGAQVAVVPSLMNGLPVGMEAPVRQALEGLLNLTPRANPDLFPPYHPYPWQFRLISASATTDSQGAYRIEHLTEGTYSAICTLPDGVQTALPLDNHLHITHPIPRFNLNYGQTGYDMGITEFTWEDAKEKAQTNER